VRFGCFHFCDHLQLDFGLPLSKVRFTVIARTYRDDVAHAIGAVVSQGDDVMTFQVSRPVLTYKTFLAKVFALAAGTLLNGGPHLWIAGVLPIL
jgi:hypothetical protein